MKILKYGNPILRKKAKAVSKIDDKIRKLVDDMFYTMLNSDPQGIGLAAPQVGVLLKIIIIEVQKDEPLSLVNPVIVKVSGKETALEGCLSIPGIFGNVERAKRIEVKGINPYTNNKVVIQAQGLKARAIQHEIDHLNGILFTDYIEKIEDLTIDEGYKLPEKLIERFKGKE